MPHTRAWKYLPAAAAAGALLAATLWSASAAAQRVPVPLPMKSRSAAKAEEMRGPLEPAIGKADAPVTIVSFSDYQCPYCRELSSTLQSLVAEHPDRIRVVYRHFALTPQSRAMSEAVLCASEQGRFAEYHQLVFGTRGVTDESLPGLAEQLGLDTAAFRECTDSARYAARIDADVREGDRLGIQVTPTFFINGVRMVGAASPEKLRNKIAEIAPKASLGNDAP